MENMDRLHVAGLRREELEILFAELGWPRFRARQLFRGFTTERPLILPKCIIYPRLL